MSWIKIEDRLPEILQMVITCEKGSQNVDCAIRAYNGKLYRATDLHGADSLNVSHWMPLPEPPKD